MLPQGLSLRYQPIISATSGRLVAVEALLRENDERVAPLRMLSDAVHAGESERLDRAVIEHACEELATWHDRGLHVPVHVNVSAATAMSANAVRFAGWLSALTVTHSSVTIEVTETTRIRNVAGLVAFVEACHAGGFEVAIDDFGCGYSTLRLLQRFRADVVKLDRRFVTPLPDDVWTRSIVRHMIALAHDLGMRVIGEGVETQEQAAWLVRLDCDELQGYAIAHPLTGNELVLWAASHSVADRATG